VSDNAVISGLPVMKVPLPIRGTDMDFDVAGERFVPVKLERSAREIRSLGQIPYPRGKNFHGPPVHGVQVSEIRLRVPEAAHKAFRYWQILPHGLSEDRRVGRLENGILRAKPWFRHGSSLRLFIRRGGQRFAYGGARATLDFDLASGGL
jgi:hypothetical protein